MNAVIVLLGECVIYRLSFSFCSCFFQAVQAPCVHIYLTGTVEIGEAKAFFGRGPLASSAPAGPWGHSFYSSFSYVSNGLHLRNSRSTLTRYNLGHSLPQVCFYMIITKLFQKKLCWKKLNIYCFGFFFLFYNPAGSECSASSCIWSKISQVCTGTSTILKEFKNKCTFNEPVNLI